MRINIEEASGNVGLSNIYVSNADRMKSTKAATEELRLETIVEDRQT